MSEIMVTDTTREAAVKLAALRKREKKIAADKAKLIDLLVEASGPNGIVFDAAGVPVAKISHTTREIIASDLCRKLLSAAMLRKVTRRSECQRVDTLV